MLLRRFHLEAGQGQVSDQGSRDSNQRRNVAAESMQRFLAGEPPRRRREHRPAASDQPETGWPDIHRPLERWRRADRGEVLPNLRLPMRVVLERSADVGDATASEAEVHQYGWYAKTGQAPSQGDAIG
jgi:hypothetical protein